jgi:SAM-dependent methyltransferase
VVDAGFSEPRLAALYDPLDPDRSDLEVYAAMAAEFGAGSVLDIGCGTGTFACLLAARGLSVVGLDPALASVEIARAKPFGDRVRWVHGTVAALPPLQVDLVTMTANVAQVFLSDQEWADVLAAAHAALRPGGRLVFETRDPARRAWLEWGQPDLRAVIPGTGGVRTRRDVTEVSGEFVSFRTTYAFESDGTVLTSDSTLRFRGREAILGSLADAGFAVEEIRDAPDRPGLEFVFVATPRLQAPSGA